MLNENEVKEKIITLRSGNAKLAIIPEVGACITRYFLKTEEQVLEPVSYTHLTLPTTPYV